MIQVMSATGELIPVSFLNFSDGATTLKMVIREELLDKPLTITFLPTTPVNDFFWLIPLVLSSLHYQSFSGERNLHLPYLPHGRADRVFEKGNPLPLSKVLATFNKFDKVTIVDPHTIDNLLLLGNQTKIEVIPQHKCFIHLFLNKVKENTVLVSPDKGAYSKVLELKGELSSYMKHCEVVVANKVRENGKIIKTELKEDVDLTGKECIIVDDICDGGGTFIPLAKLLKEKGASSVKLYVTHMIGSKGLDVFKGVIDELLVYQCVGKYVNSCDIMNFNNGY